MFSNVALIFVAIVQPEGAVPVDQTIAYGWRKIVDIFAEEQDGSAEPCKPTGTKEDTGHVGRGLGKGPGVLLLGVTASFLIKDTFGHDDGNHIIVIVA
jgi:hypothetical protein